MDGFTSRSDEVESVGHWVFLELAVTLAIVVKYVAGPNRKRSVFGQPDVAVGVANVMGDWHAGVQLFPDSSVALHHLSAEGVTRNHDLLHVRKLVCVVEVLYELVHDFVRGDGIFVVLWVLGVATSGPLRALPHKSVGSRAAAWTQSVGPRVCVLISVALLVVAAGEHGGQNGNIVLVDSVAWIELGQGAEHVRFVSTGISVKTMNDDDCALQLGVIKSPALEVVVDVVNECQVVVLPHWILDPEVGDFGTWKAWQVVLDDIAGILLGRRETGEGNCDSREGASEREAHSEEGRDCY